MKKWIVLLLLAALLCSALGCSRRNDGTTLWVVTERTTWDRMNGQALAVQEAFEQANPGVKIRLDFLPTDKQERSAYLQQLRTQITQGRGPDAYLLPTADRFIVDDGGTRAFYTVEPLFADVALAMKNGLFRDLSPWYDTDTELGKESLNTAVMDGGVLDGSRYVLPLHYDMTVIYAQLDALQGTGIDEATLQKPLSELMESALATKNTRVIAGAFYEGSSGFADWIDYASGQVTLTETDLTSYLDTFRHLLTATQTGGAAPINVSNYARGYYNTSLALIRYPLYIGSLSDLLEYAPVAQYEGSDYTILPLQTENGTVATVTYYAAMGAGCKNPELTYAFLRQFLLEDSQFERNRPTKMNILVGNPPSKFTQSQTQKNQYPGLIEEGWPVRTEGSLNPLWAVRRKQFYSSTFQGEYRSRMRKIGLSDLDEKWAQILQTPIDQVRFPSVMDAELKTVLGRLNDPTDSFRPTDLSTQDLAQDFLWDMRRHVSEG